MKIKTGVKAGGKATPILERKSGNAITLLRDSGRTLKVKTGLKAGGIKNE